jgi:hypothetical protein
MEPTAPTPTEPTAEPDGAFRSLAALIGAAEVASFLQQTLGRAAHRTRLAPGVAQDLFGWPQLNAALAEHRLAPPRLRLERTGADVTAEIFKSRRTRRGASFQDLSPAALMEQLRAGATLIVDAVNEISPPLQALCSGLAAEFTASSQANLYACWGTTQGFEVHWDDHDVFVVQVEGSKEWALYGATEAAPTRRGPAPEASPPTYEPERLVLAPGDVLYLPRGYWHAAVGLGGPTLHLTIGLTRKTGSDLLHWLADDLLVETLGRADLPFEAGDAALGVRIGEILAGLAARDPQALARSYRRHVEATTPQRPALAFPYIGDETLLGPTARISLAHGATCLEHRGEDLVLSWRGVEFTLAPALEAPLRRLLAGEALRADAFADAASRADVQAFLRDMVRRGAFIARPEED